MAVPDPLQGIGQEWASTKRPMDMNAIHEVDSLARKTITAVEKRIRYLETYGQGGSDLSQEITTLADSIENISRICDNALEPTSQSQAELAGRLLQIRDQLKIFAQHAHDVYQDIVLKEEELQADFDHNSIHLVYPDALEYEAKKCFSLFERAVDPKVKQFYADWTCKYYEMAAFAYIKQGDQKSINKAAHIRHLLATQPDLFRSSKLNKAFIEDINHPALMQHALLGEMNLGVGITDVGGTAIKRQALHVSEIPLDGSNKKVISFKMTYPHADHLRENMQMLSENPSGYKELMENALGHEISIREEPYMYYHKNKEEGSFSSRAPAARNEPGALKMGNALVVEMAGVGRVEIGNSREFASMYNKVRIVLEEGATEEELQKLLAICGLTQMYADTTTSERQRLECNFVLHQLYPAFMARKDKEADFYTRSLQSILNELDKEIPGSGKEVLDAMTRVERYTIMPGVEGMKIKGRGEEITREGARGFVSGVGTSNSIKQASQIVSSIVQSGALSSQTRYDQGLLLGGACSETDHKRNGADSVFTRVVTQKALDNREVIETMVIRGKYQILYHVDIADQQNYCHRGGYYGCRNPQDRNYGKAYLNRPSLKEHTQNNQQSWVNTNEVMFKNRLDSGYIKQILYQDPRKTLMRAIIEQDPDFFQDYDSIPERVAYITELGKSEEGKNRLRQALGERQEQFEALYSLEEHWTVDPKAQLIEDLTALGVNSIGGESLHDIIQEADYFSDDAFKNCHGRPYEQEEEKE